MAGFHPRLIFMDFQLPGMDGLRAAGYDGYLAKLLDRRRLPPVVSSLLHPART